jgi:hypothetical protein
MAFEEQNKGTEECGQRTGGKLKDGKLTGD